MISIKNWENYKTLVEKAGALSRLFSDSDVPFLHPRFVEYLYCATTGSTNLARDDVSFDARSPIGGGVGVKTFRVGSFKSKKTEKIAEFTAQAGTGRYAGLDPDEVAVRVALDRNKRVIADLAAYKIDIDKSIYHCLVRGPGECMVHEEPYRLIEIDSIFLTNRPIANGPIKFSDGHSSYAFVPAKNTLYKTFEIGTQDQSLPINVSIREDIFKEFLGDQNLLPFPPEHADDRDFVVLPLYSDSSGKVEERSGINQWNAGGRVRKFGEAYIPIPAKIHRLKPGFFPARDIPFELSLPDGSLITAKVCQSGGKALMSNPNDLLITWLFSQIDGDIKKASLRLAERRPYSDEDLLAIGRDSVVIHKEADGSYTLSPGATGRYQEFIDNLEVD